MVSSITSTSSTIAESWIFCTSVPTVNRLLRVTNPPKGHSACSDAVDRNGMVAIPASSSDLLTAMNAMSVKKKICTYSLIRDLRFWGVSMLSSSVHGFAGS